jgi:hypothetical protein
MELWKIEETGVIQDDADKDIKAWRAWLNAKCDDAFDDMDMLEQEIPLWCVFCEMRSEVEQLRQALAVVRKYADDTHDYWDDSQDAKVGKRLLAMAGKLKGYDADLDKALSLTGG